MNCIFPSKSGSSDLSKINVSTRRIESESYIEIFLVEHGQYFFFSKEIGDRVRLARAGTIVEVPDLYEKSVYFQSLSSYSEGESLLEILFDLRDTSDELKILVDRESFLEVLDFLGEEIEGIGRT